MMMILVIVWIDIHGVFVDIVHYSSYIYQNERITAALYYAITQSVYA